ncbi:Ribonuclease precursor [Slackia heliotrinireducens]|uniref:Ribonuclease n=1 Tax=Slackia heliotrinireducens (strain ATCC 29202 / DSM 20476 / NCTC 11029 / RHS 1) TaxID=471855 RepID=C7N531_SLAHD|nr:ribonuclease domain-containing protein [Slackia heliotrinireducens]ACV22016.1 ribonuclease [Slackia heliotrinireducens DSM 20476]VEG99935.1 Ribonuclease precursor [Slackia heliotrinireducens]
MQESRTKSLIVGTALLLLLALAWIVLPSVAGGSDADNASDTAAVTEQATEADAADESSETEPTPAGGQAEQEGADVEAESASDGGSEPAASGAPSIAVTENGEYITKDEVAAYIHEFGHLPGNFISKTKAKDAGWKSVSYDLDEVCPGKSIGGSRFYNDEGLLPDADGRTWTECDINYTGGNRGAERIVFSNDGLIFYTSDHYETFEQLY